MNLNKFIKEEKNTNNENLEINIKDLKLDSKELQKNNNKIKESSNKFLPWFIKYIPKTFDDLVITPEVEKLINLLDNYKKGKGILLYGSPGCGKTTTVKLIAKEKDYEILEVNASDTRNKANIIDIVRNAIKQQSLFNQKKLILVDEVDGVSGKDDRGGISEIIKIIKESNYPIVLTANDIDSNNLKQLLKANTLINFEKDSEELLFKIGERILKRENLKFNEKELKELVKKRNLSDIRSFINDLQFAYYNGKIDILIVEERNYKKIIENLIQNLYELTPDEAYKGNINTDVRLDEYMLFLEENIPYAKKNTYEMFEQLSKADLFFGRIIKWQYWRYLVYINFYLNYGVSAYLNEKIPVKKNTRILKKWIYNNKVSFLKTRTKAQKVKGDDLTIIEKLSKFYHCSTNKFKKEIFPYFLINYKNSEEFRNRINNVVGISKDIENKILILEL